MAHNVVTSPPPPRRGAAALASLVAPATVVGFTGARRPSPRCADAVRLALSLLSPSAAVLVGCAAGVDRGVRSACHASHRSLTIFRASDYGAGRGALVARSVSLVRSLAAVARAGGRPLLVAAPSKGCPAGVVPSASPRHCFCGGGSGSWASAALAAGLGVPVLLFLPPGVVPPSGWGFVAIAGAAGWFHLPERRQPALDLSFTTTSAPKGAQEVTMQSTTVERRRFSLETDHGNAIEIILDITEAPAVYPDGSLPGDGEYYITGIVVVAARDVRGNRLEVAVQ